MIEYILYTLILFLAGCLGQLIDIFLNFGKNAEQIRDSDGTNFGKNTDILELFTFYLRSRSVGLFVTFGLIFLIAFVGNIDIIRSIFPTLEGRAILFIFIGYGGQQAIRDFMTATSRNVLKKIGNNDV